MGLKLPNKPNNASAFVRRLRGAGLLVLLAVALGMGISTIQASAAIAEQPCGVVLSSAGHGGSDGNLPGDSAAGCAMFGGCPVLARAMPPTVPAIFFSSPATIMKAEFSAGRSTAPSLHPPQTI